MVVSLLLILLFFITPMPISFVFLGLLVLRLIWKFYKVLLNILYEIIKLIVKIIKKLFCRHDFERYTTFNSYDTKTGRPVMLTQKKKNKIERTML